jgi:hypothetical protein
VAEVSPCAGTAAVDDEPPGAFCARAADPIAIIIAMKKAAGGMRRKRVDRQ